MAGLFPKGDQLRGASEGRSQVKVLASAHTLKGVPVGRWVAPLRCAKSYCRAVFFHVVVLHAVCIIVRHSAVRERERERELQLHDDALNPLMFRVQAHERFSANDVGRTFVTVVLDFVHGGCSCRLHINLHPPTPHQKVRPPLSHCGRQWQTHGLQFRTTKHLHKMLRPGTFRWRVNWGGATCEKQLTDVSRLNVLNVCPSSATSSILVMRSSLPLRPRLHLLFCSLRI